MRLWKANLSIMEKENLKGTVDASKNETPSKFKKTGRKYVSKQKRLSSFSAFVRVLIVVVWLSTAFSAALKGFLEHQIAVQTFLLGIIASLLWFTVGDIHTEKEIEWEEYIDIE